MKKSFLMFSLLLLLPVFIHAQEKKSSLYSVAFYNLENLFDTIHDTGKDDYEFLPNGDMKWTSAKYEAKLKNISKVLSELSCDKVAEGPSVIGVAEVENIRVLNDLVKQLALMSRGYKIVHYEGPDKRGIDCALLYNPKLFTVTSSKLVPYIYVNDTIHKTRGFLVVNGKLAGDDVCVIVNHWPSRGATSPARVRAAVQVKALKDSLIRADKQLKLIVMGDLNDDPMDESVSVALGAKKYEKQVKKGELYNPWWETLEDKGVGTLLYHGKWNLFDQIMISSSLLHAKKGLKYDHNEVFKRPYLFEQEGKYKGSPFRTYGGKTWLNGYSDHLPTIIYLTK
ncbi:endonuclease/exonuclease/phosphatase family protein [Bacteroides ihuae]|uniref:endonuclease/exonuclease/phosphatase family protein n=1 Tax=Bacteroides ihuae TaxID=1852362 RepID=UPI0008DAEED5|nr:endonuclease/exonuclease/phosphatase family protein [Bacteroides ihuae]